MAALEHPPVLCRKALNAREPVRHEGHDPLLGLRGERREDPSPPPGRLVAGYQERVLEHCLSPADRPEEEQVECVLLSLEREPEPIDDREELPRRNRWWRETSEEEGESGSMAAPHPLTADTAACRVLTEARPSEEHPEGTLRVSAQRFPPSSFLPGAPGPLAAGALPAAPTNVMHLYPAARGFLVKSFHTREFSSRRGCGRLSSAKNLTSVSTEFPCHTQAVTPQNKIIFSYLYHHSLAGKNNFDTLSLMNTHILSHTHIMAGELF